MTNVLLAIDGPTYGKVIEDFVVNYHWSSGTNFKLIHVIEPIQYIDASPQPQLDVNHFQQDSSMLEEAAARIKKALPDVNVTLEIRHGFAKEEIIAESIEWPANMIVIGSHGRHGLQRFLLGSVSMSIIMHAPCSVVMIRLPQAVQEQIKHDYAVLRAGEVDTPNK